ITRANQFGEARRPAEMRGFLAQRRAGLVADHRQRDAQRGQTVEHRADAREWLDALEMNFVKALKIMLARLLPGVAPHLDEAMPHRLVDGVPTVDQRVVPVEQHRARPGHAAPSMKSR